MTTTKMAETIGLLGGFAHLLGTSEDGLRLLLSILAGYPISFLHRKYLYGKPAIIQHIFFIATGLTLGCFNFGWDMLHAIAAIGITYLILAILGGGTVSLALVFTYTMSHLLLGYWFTATTEYDIKWTMPQCVITLRLIGLAFNLSDGQEPDDKVSAENKKVSIRETPGPLEIFAHNLYPPSFIIGPQISMIRFRQFVDLSLRGKDGVNLPDSVRAGLLRGLLGIVYLLIYMYGSSYVPDDYILSDEFMETSFWKRYVLIGLWGRVTLYKYISCWLLAEGACIVNGLTYNGKDDAGIDKWDGCSNVKISVFETATRMNHYIDSFNINTNHWVAQYIYKRLKFLNNKVMSQLGVLFFLAIWHGFHSGYYATFFFEFISILAEKELITTINRYPAAKQIIDLTAVQTILFVTLRIYTFTCMGYAMSAFILLKHRKYLQVYASLYYTYHLLFFAVIAGSILIRKLIPPVRSKDKKSE